MKQAGALAFMLGLLVLGSLRAAVAEGLAVYIPIADFLPSGAPVYPEPFQKLSELVPRLSPGARAEMVPIRRAHFMYGASQDACILDADRPAAAGELRSHALFANDFWLYVPGHSRIREPGEIRRVGTIAGAELYLKEAEKDRFTWSYAPNYTALVAMLQSSRVDAVTLAAYYFQRGGKVSGPLRRVGARPVMALSFGLRCKETQKGIALMRALEAAWPPA
jgi:hypothetical protein